MNLHLAGVAPWREEGIYNPIIEREAGVKCHLAGIQGKAKTVVLEPDGNSVPKRRVVHILESFYYADKFTEKMIPYYGEFLLDSGAFTLFTDGKKGRGIVWEEYVDKYADFIKRNDVRHFFELYIDKLVCYDEVKRLRKRLERKAERPCIPVWHKSRGKDDYIRICQKYDYIAVGGLVGAGGAGAVPEGNYDSKNMSSTVVPFRNGIMLSVAVGLAASRKLAKVVLGNHGGDHFIYPDCRSEFIDAMCKAACLGTDGKVEVRSPFDGITKADIVKIGADLGVPFELTYSCYKGGKNHCGKCGTCRERREAFESAGVPDPTKYDGKGEWYTAKKKGGAR